MKKTFLTALILFLFLPALYSTDFTLVDEAVLNLPRSAQTSPDKLIMALDEITGSSWEKTRAVWTWLTHNIAYDTESYFSGQPGPVNAEDTFTYRTSVCNGYAELFVLLAGGMGLEAVKISGYGKGYSYRDGVISDGSNHAWNAVKIMGEWHLFDATWGAGHLRGRDFQWAYDEFFFDTPPEKLIFSHLPENSAFQLLEKPVSRNLFFNLPNMKGLAGRYDMDFSKALNQARAGKKVELPLLYESKHAVFLKSIPLKKSLESGTTYSFELESPSTRLMIKNGTGDPEIMKSRTGRYRFKKKFSKGQLVFYIGHPDEENSGFSGFLAYNVH